MGGAVLGHSYADRRYPWATCLKFRTVCFCQSPSRLSSRAINSATRGAASMLARAPSNRARVLRASTSSTVRAISARTAQTTSAPMYGSSG